MKLGIFKRLRELEDRVTALEQGSESSYAWYDMPSRHEIDGENIRELYGLWGGAVQDFREYVDDEGEDYNVGFYL